MIKSKVVGSDAVSQVRKITKKINFPKVNFVTATYNMDKIMK
jgi:hypothetical protein